MNINEVTEEEVKKNQDLFLDRVEKGECFLVTRADGTKYMMVPQDPNELTYPPCDIQLTLVNFYLILLDNEVF